MKILKRSSALALMILMGVCGSAWSAEESSQSDSVTIYYDDSDSNFGDVNIYYWYNPSSGNWPGTAMTKIGDKIWQYTFSEDPSSLNGMIFCNSAGNSQTADYTVPPVDGHLYKGQANKGQVVDMGVYDPSAQPDPEPDPTPDPDPTPEPDPEPIPVQNLITDYYKVNPDGKCGSYRTVNMNFVNDGLVKSTTALGNWTEDDLIAQGVARDVCMAIKGKHERPVIDSYAIYGAYDDKYLYLGVQLVYMVWDQYGEGKQPKESKPYNMDGRLMWAFDLNPAVSFDGYLDNGNPVWNDDPNGAYFQNGVDALWLGSSKPGVGTPGFFVPNANGHTDYNSSCKTIPGQYYGYADGLLPSIDAIYGQSSFEYDPAVLEGNTGFVDLKSQIDESAHTFYEWKFPLSTLNVSADYISSKGIGVMFIDVYGSSPVGGTPYDPSYFDNVKKSYSKDPSTSAEKEDKDIITYTCARIGKIASTDVSNLLDVSEAKIAVSNGAISIIGAEGCNVTVAGVDGNVYYSGAGAEEMNVSVRGGLYIVNVGGTSKKVIVK